MPKADLKKKTILLTAGGTGGHLFPAEALARELAKQGYKIVFVTDKRGVKFQKFDDIAIVKAISSATIVSGIIGKITGLFKIGLGALQASLLLLKYRPSVIVGFGGYPSFPAMIMGQVFKVPTIIHEQNAVLGKANAFLAKKATAIAASMPDTKGIKENNYAEKTSVCGNPVRPAIQEKEKSTYKAPSKTGQINILILGGSQGAKIFSDILPDVFKSLPTALKKRLNITQQCHAGSLATTRLKYDGSGLNIHIDSFFEDAASEIEKCHLFIGRSGASTVAEITVIGRPAIFVPLMVHADQQQKLNAEILSAQGAAWLTMPEDFTVEKITEQLKSLLTDTKTLEKVAKKSQKYGQADAAFKLTELVAKLAGDKVKPVATKKKKTPVQKSTTKKTAAKKSKSEAAA